MHITTLRTMAGSQDCPDIDSCPSVHDLDTDPERRYVISKRTTDPHEVAAFRHLMAAGEVLGWMPAGFLSDANELFDRTREVTSPGMRPERRYVITTPVTDPRTLREFARLIAPTEQLGAVPARARQEV